MKSQYKPNNTKAESDNHIRFDRAPKPTMIAQVISRGIVIGAAIKAAASGPTVDTNNRSETVKGSNSGVRYSCKARNAIPARTVTTKTEVPVITVRRM